MISIPKSFVKDTCRAVPFVGPLVGGVGIAIDIKEIAEKSTPMGVVKTVGVRLIKECTPPELLLVHNVLAPGSQIVFSKSLCKIYIAKNILIRIITEVKVERKRRALGLPRPKFKINMFKKQEK